MKTLKLGATGPEVSKWQIYLRGLDLYQGTFTAVFDAELVEATKQFQKNKGLNPDGIVGNHTMGVAMADGFPILDDSKQFYDEVETSPAWPAPAENLKPMSSKTREELFSAFEYKAAPAPGNPENITILGSWVKDNISPVEIPEFSKIKGFPAKFYFHNKAHQQLKDLVKAWDEEGMLDLLKTWGGAWAPRFIRGSKTTLSNHAFGTAFDINVAWNGLGQRPALVGQTGSVRKLVPLANKFGFFWGGHYNGRLDGMHFECAKLIA